MEIKYMNESIQKEIYGDINPYTPKGVAILKRYLRETNGFYYARPKEEFFKAEGIGLAIEKKADYVILEDLS